MLGGGGGVGVEGRVTGGGRGVGRQPQPPINLHITADRMVLITY